jgi:uncharacterized protein (TIGR03086 family)
VADDAIARHLRACARFTAIVQDVGDRWSSPTPCSDWDARGVVEHVIGFHDVLLLRPLNLKPRRPRGDPVARWAVTVSAIESVMPDLGEGLVLATPGDTYMDLGLLLPMLTGDVLVHTWDLAKAIGVLPSLDPEMVERAYNDARMGSNLRTPDMFGPSIPVPDDADMVTKLVALLGRDPGWQSP